MSNIIAELFQDPAYCRAEILRIREAIGNKATATQRTFDASIRTLGFMVSHAPEEMQTLVHSQLSETSTRERYFAFLSTK